MSDSLSRPAATAADFVFLSALMAPPESRGDVALETRLILARADEELRRAGSSLDRVVSATVFLTSQADFQTMNGAYRPFFPADPPTRTTVIVALPEADARVQIALVAVRTDAERIVVHPAEWALSPNPYSYGIRTGDTLFLSGLVPRRGRDNSPITGDIEVQTRAILDNAEAILGSAGLGLTDIVATRVYLTKAANFAGMNRAYGVPFGDRPPARATVVCGLAGPDFDVEMTFLASSAPKQFIGTPPPGIPISPAVRAGRLVYFSGMLGNVPETAGNPAAQTTETFARIDRTLNAAGMRAADVVDATVFVKDMAYLPAVDDPYRSFFPSQPPARTVIGAPLVVDDGLVEIMVTAAG